MLNRTYCIAYLLITSFLLSACGFHLRGHTPQLDPIESFALTGNNRFGGIANEVELLATNQKITIDAQSPWRLQVGDERVDQWRASTSYDYSSNEYWLSMSVNIIIAHQAIEYRPITLKREALFQDNSDQLNSKAPEKARILQELRQLLAREVLQQLAYIINNPPDCDCDEAQP